MLVDRDLSILLMWLDIYLIEEAGGPIPTEEELNKIRSKIRLDVVEYLQEKGFLLKKK